MKKLKKQIEDMYIIITKLENENFQLKQNLKQCENGYNLELHTLNYKVIEYARELKLLKEKFNYDLILERKRIRKVTTEKLINKIFEILGDENTPIANSFINLVFYLREIANREHFVIKGANYEKEND